MGDFTIIRGDSCYISVIKQDENNTQIDFDEGDSVILSVKKNLKQQIYDIQSSSNVITDGQIVIELLPTQTDIGLGDYYYDIEYKTKENDVYTLSRGMITIEWDVTRDE